MSESIKAVLLFIMAVAAFAGSFAWVAENPGPLVWTLRTGGPITAIAAIAGIVFLCIRRDRIADYLRAIAGDRFFNRDGFCFALSITEQDGICYLLAHFQNQYDQPSEGQIALRPARKFFGRRSQIDPLAFEIRCEPAAFGVAKIPLPVSRDLLGSKQPFEVGASVRYPQGKGTQLRFRDGLFLRTDSRFNNAFGTAVSVFGLMSGSFMTVKPATVTFVIPAMAASDVPESATAEVRTLWRLGDAPLGPGEETPHSAVAPPA
jgi:hypothetical protein